MDYLVKIRLVQTPLNGQFSIGANIFVIILRQQQKRVRPRMRKLGWTNKKIV